MAVQRDRIKFSAKNCTGNCIGYSLAFVFCIIAIIIVSANDCNRGRALACCRSADPENDGEERRDLMANLLKRQNWEGEYVNDEVLQTKWCKPTGKDADTEAQLRDLTIIYIVMSKMASYVLLIVFSIITGFVVTVYDICGCGEKSCCRNIDSDQESLEQGMELSSNIET
ncbi:hypothetical protein Q8A67_005843 [Cirrhinus molitorella]|uniref:Uncharacterized protein n=1 Tax=Cirrhinus molitorella TaxID=172907 RepID=A0AA88Q6T6_9TELE|nr:hypothetical protein Q8A67_005843 [Cirrhinus molitorella]